MARPLFDIRRRARSLLIAYGLFCVLYCLPDRVALRAPALLPELWPDRFPALGWSLPVYLSHLLFLPWALCRLRDALNFDRTLRAMLLAAGLAAAAFLLFPTRLPAAAPPSGAWQLAFDWTAALFAATNSNCFPSLHVALACLAALGLRRERHPRAPAALAWAAAIAVSTVTAKQHYALDVLGGLLLAAVADSLAGRRLRARASPSRGEAPGPLPPLQNAPA